MAYDSMYEGDGFIRKGPAPKDVKESRPVEKNTERKKKTWRGGITVFHLMRLLFNH